MSHVFARLLSSDCPSIVHNGSDELPALSDVPVETLLDKLAAENMKLQVEERERLRQHELSRTHAETEAITSTESGRIRKLASSVYA